MNNFSHPVQGQSGLVCNGSYCEETHGPLFRALCKLLIRQYPKNVLQSFMHYLPLEYFQGKSIQLCVDNVGRTVQVPNWTCVSHKLEGKNSCKWKAEFLKDLEIGVNAIGHAANATWWNWDCSSTLFFWRWL